MAELADRSTARSTAAPEERLLLADPSIRLRRRETRLVITLRIGLAIVLLGAWQLVSGPLISDFWVSRPTAIWEALERFARDGQLAPAVAATLWETLLGFGFGAAAGIFVGFLFGTNRLVARVLDPYVIGFNSIPRVALVPLFILWFGIGIETKVIFAALLVFFPVFMNTLSGARDVDRDLIDVLRVMGATRGDTLRKVLLPSSLSWVFTGLRTSIPFALIGAVIAEMFTSDSGLGYLISLSANQYDTAGTFAALLATTVLGLALTAVVALLERRLIRWRPID